MYQCKYCEETFETAGKLGGHIVHCSKNPDVTTVYICEFCSTEIIGKHNYTFHSKHCNNNPQKILYGSSFNKIQDNLFCSYCLKQCKNLNALKLHELRCKENPDHIINTGNHISTKGVKCPLRGWSKGLTAETDNRVNNIKVGLNKAIANGLVINAGRKLTLAEKDNLSTIARNNHYETHFGRHLTHKYNGYTFQSSYEVKVAKELDLNGVQWVLPQRLPYIDNNGKKHHYTPDFYLPEYNVYLDPKNDFLIENINPTFGFSDKDKIFWVMSLNNVKIIILNKDQLSWKEIKAAML